MVVVVLFFICLIVIIFISLRLFLLVVVLAALEQFLEGFQPGTGPDGDFVGDQTPSLNPAHLLDLNTSSDNAILDLTIRSNDNAIKEVGVANDGPPSDDTTFPENGRNDLCTIRDLALRSDEYLVADLACSVRYQGVRT